MAYFLGFDAAKAKLDWSLINDQGIEQLYGTTANNEAAIAGLLLTVSGRYPGVSLVCTVESTGCYHYNLTAICCSLELPCLVLNPIITRQQIKATIRGKKTDRTDACMIARLGLRGEGRLCLPEPFRSTKYLARSIQKLGTFAKAINSHHRHLTGLAEAELSSEADALMQDIQAAVTAARDHLRQDMAASADSGIFNLLQTIKGIGPYTAASIASEVQDIRRFRSAKSLIAYAGLDPKIKQSGKKLNSTGRLTKRGSTYLRRSIFIAANIARQHDPQFKALYDRKLAEGKSHTVATIVVARKLLRVIRAVWLSGKPYTVPENYA